MKRWNKTMMAALAAVVLTVQPAWAAGPELVQPGWVNMELGPGAATWVEDPAGASVPAETVTESQVPALNAAETQSQVVVQAAPGAESGNPGSSPVIVAGGQTGETSAAGAAETAEPSGEAGQEGTAEETEQLPDGMVQLPADGAELQAADGTLQETSGRQIDPSRPMVALTYDDGPQPSVGNRIMDCLAQYGGKATFFMVGDRVPSYASEVQRMVAEGHEVANHSMNHKYLQKLGAAEIQSQVVRCNDVIEQVSGVRPTIMRLPGGNHNATVRANVNMPMIQWNIDTLDWKTRNADSTVASVLNHVKDGDIILMHELYSQTGDATERIVPELVNRGYQLVTVSEMAAAKGITLQAGQLYSALR